MIQSSAFLSNWSLPAALFIQAQVLAVFVGIDNGEDVECAGVVERFFEFTLERRAEADAVRFGGDSHFFSYRCYRVVVIAQHVWQVFRENGRRIFGVYRIIAGVAHEDIFQ